MAQLSSVIGSILRDIIAAQHEANLYSISLSESYGKDGKAKNFQLPNVVLSDMELDLKYAVIAATESQEQFNIKYSKFRRFLGGLCGETAQTTVSSAVASVLNSEIMREENDKRFFYHLRQDKKLNKKFQAFLSRNMRNAFMNNLHESIDSKTGNVIVDVVVDRLMDVIRLKFLGDSDLDKLFSGTDGAALKRNVEESIHTALKGLVAKLSKDTNFKRSKMFPQLDVAVTADELGNLQEESIHCFKLKFSPTTVDVAAFESDEELDDFVMN